MYWQLINSVTPYKGGLYTVESDDFTLPKVTLANTRTVIRRLGDPYYDDTSVPSKCPTSKPGEGLYSDVDDLIVELADNTESDTPTKSPTPTLKPNPDGSSCYDLSVHKCGCTPDTCNEELCTEAGMIWTDTCPEACTCDDFGTPTKSPTPTLNPNPDGSSCYDINIHKCGCTPDTCSEELCTEAGMIWTDTCPEACTCDAFGEDKAKYNPVNMAPQCGGSLDPISAPLEMCTTVGTG